MAEADTLTYEAACERIEAIIARLDSGEAGLRETLELCQEGRRLVEFCAAELDAVGRGLEELRLDELVARLSAERLVALGELRLGREATGGRRGRFPCRPSCLGGRCATPSAGRYRRNPRRRPALTASLPSRS